MRIFFFFYIVPTWPWPRRSLNPLCIWRFRMNTRWIRVMLFMTISGWKWASRPAGGVDWIHSLTERHKNSCWVETIQGTSQGEACKLAWGESCQVGSKRCFRTVLHSKPNIWVQYDLHLQAKIPTTKEVLCFHRTRSMRFVRQQVFVKTTEQFSTKLGGRMGHEPRKKPLKKMEGSRTFYH